MPGGRWRFPMSQSSDQALVTRIAQRHLRALSEGQAFVKDIEKGLNQLKDAIDLATLRSSDNYETGQALADWNSDAAAVVTLTREFSNKVAPHLRRIR